MGSPRIIKKYPNRRLYDTECGEYITLDEIKKLVVNHVEFIVIDAQTANDITQPTLFQIITEQENTKSPMFTTEMLQDFIRLYHNKSQTIFTQYLEQAMRSFIQQKDFLLNQWQSYQTIFTPAPIKKSPVGKKRPAKKKKPKK